MNTYQITRVGESYQVIVTTRGYGSSIVRKFTSEDAAQAWLIRHLSSLNLADLSRWIREKATSHSDDVASA
jgi:hypothetical protein